MSLKNWVSVSVPRTRGLWFAQLLYSLASCLCFNLHSKRECLRYCKLSEVGQHNKFLTRLLVRLICRKKVVVRVASNNGAGANNAAAIRTLAALLSSTRRKEWEVYVHPKTENCHQGRAKLQRVVAVPSTLQVFNSGLLALCRFSAQEFANATI